VEGSDCELVEWAFRRMNEVGKALVEHPELDLGWSALISCVHLWHSHLVVVVHPRSSFLYLWGSHRR
jgi:hypothetical protein